MGMSRPDINTLDAGIRPLVKYLWYLGYETTDSGDGTGFGKEDMAGVWEVPHVAVHVPGSADLVHYSNILFYWLTQKGLKVGVEACYTPGAPFDYCQHLIVTMEPEDLNYNNRILDELNSE